MLSYDPTNLTEILAIISVGYFIYDAGDMILDTNSKLDHTLLVHHSLTSFAFFVSLCNHRFQIYAMAAWLHEVQSVFLHFRRLLNLAKVDRSTTIYQMAKYLNFFSFIMFRFVVNFWMLYAAWVSGDQLGPLVPYAGIAFNGAFIYLNYGVFAAILKSDFGSSRNSQSKNHKNN